MNLQKYLLQFIVVASTVYFITKGQLSNEIIIYIALASVLGFILMQNLVPGVLEGFSRQNRRIFEQCVIKEGTGNGKDRKTGLSVCCNPTSELTDKYKKTEDNKDGGDLIRDPAICDIIGGNNSGNPGNLSEDDWQRQLEESRRRFSGTNDIGVDTTLVIPPSNDNGVSVDITLENPPGNDDGAVTLSTPPGNDDGAVTVTTPPSNNVDSGDKYEISKTSGKTNVVLESSSFWNFLPWVD